MHVLLIPSWYSTPENPVHGSFFREQAHALSRAGHRVGVIAPRLRSVRELVAGLRESRAGVTVEDDGGVATYRLQGAQFLPGLQPANDRGWVAAGRRLYDSYVADNGAPDVIHAHAVFMGGIIGADIGGRTGVPLVITEHSTVYQRRSIPAFQIAEAQAALGVATARLVVSPQLGDTMEAVVGQAASGWEWAPNVVDPSFLKAPLQSHRDGEPFRFLNVAYLHEKKAHGDLLAAFAQRFCGDQTVQLRIGGDGDERERLRALAAELGIAGQVAWLGPLGREAVLAEMLAADAFILPSRLETFGVVVVEALACGVPVIATRSGGPECIVGEHDGVLADVGDVAALGEAMLTMRADVAAGAYDATGLRSRCEARFSERALVDQLGRVYARVTGGTA